MCCASASGPWSFWGIAPALLGSVQQIALDIVRPSAHDVRRALSKAVMQSPTFELDPDADFTITFLPLLPTAAVTTRQCDE